MAADVFDERALELEAEADQVGFAYRRLRLDLEAQAQAWRTEARLIRLREIDERQKEESL